MSPGYALGQQSPIFLAQGTGFMEDNPSMDQDWGNGFGVIQAHHIQAHLLLYTAHFLTGPDQY